MTRDTDTATGGPGGLSGARAVVWVADGSPFAGADYGTALIARLQADGFTVARRDHTQLDDCRTADGLLSDPDDEAQWHFLTGGETPTRSVAGWMPAALDHTRELLRRAADGSCSVFGMCLGAQMIAEALWPGSVSCGPVMEAGLTAVDLTADAAHGQRQWLVPEYHYEQISPGPLTRDGGRVVASGPNVPVQAFTYGARVLGVQFHPEWTPAQMAMVLDQHRTLLAAHGVDIEAALAHTREQAGSWSPALFGNLLALLSTGRGSS